MNALKSIIAIASLALGMVACAGEAQLQSNVEFAGPTPESGQTATLPQNFPQECMVNGKPSIVEGPSCYGPEGAKQCSQTSVLCTCTGATTVVRWARLKSVENGNPQYGFCPYRAPRASQIERLPLTAVASPTLPLAPVPVASAPVPATSSFTVLPVTIAPVPVASASAPVVASDSNELNGLRKCSMINNVWSCQVMTVAVGGAKSTTNYSCVGTNFVPIGSNELAKYQGGTPPCTCKAGTTMKKIDNAPNTWYCDTGK